MKIVNSFCGVSALVRYSQSGSEHEKATKPCCEDHFYSKRKSGSISEARIFRTRNGNLLLRAASCENALHERRVNDSNASSTPPESLQRQNVNERKWNANERRGKAKRAGGSAT